MRKVSGVQLTDEEIKTIRNALSIIEEVEKAVYRPDIEILQDKLRNFESEITNCGRVLGYAED